MEERQEDQGWRERQQAREERRRERRDEREAMREQPEYTQRLRTRDHPSYPPADVDQRNLGGRRFGVLQDRRPGYLPRDRYGRRRSSSGGWVIGAVLLIILGLVLWFFLSRGGTGSVAGQAGAPTAGPPSQTITSDSGQDVLAVAGDASALAALEDHNVSAVNVTVQSVVSDQGVWVGSSDQRIFVVMASQPSTTGLTPGAVVSFSGVLKVLPVDYQTRFGVDATEGAQFLGQQGHYIEATSVSLTNGA